MREEGKHKSRGSQKWKWARVVQHRRKCIDLRAGVKAKAKSNIGNSHRDRHRAGHTRIIRRGAREWLHGAAGGIWCN